MLTNNKNHPKIWTVISNFFAKSLVNINFYFIFAAMMYLVAIFSLVLLIIGLAVIYNSEQQEKVKQKKEKK